MSKQSDIVEYTTKTIGYEGYKFKFYYEGGAYIEIGLSKDSIFEVINVYDYVKGEPEKFTFAEFNKMCREWLDESAHDYIENYFPYM